MNKTFKNEIFRLMKGMNILSTIQKQFKNETKMITNSLLLEKTNTKSVEYMHNFLLFFTIFLS